VLAARDCLPHVSAETCGRQSGHVTRRSPTEWSRRLRRRPADRG
jgi:hypothetical protein